jgi:hypothetical protein
MSTPNLLKGRFVALTATGALFLAGALFISGCGNAARPVATKKADDKAKLSQSATNEVVFESQSEFDDDVKVKDPFFPKSDRRVAKAANGKPVAQVAKVADLKLRGVIGSPGKYIAMINDKTFAEGDKSQVSAGLNQSLVVKVTQITARSATVVVDGEAAPHELLLDAVKEVRK